MPPSHIGKYEVQRRLGAGGMGSLYLARDPGLDRLVAIKVLKDEYQDDPELRERFIREARSVARLRHENIIIVFDIGEADGLPFMAMEYISGETVAQVLRRNPTPELSKRLIMVEELCAGLAHAHGAGIIHRDIKPANLMITGDGLLKILDFGIARLADSGMTQGGMMLGTVNYMSPEQVAGPTVDHRSDIFATGAVLYELIALAQAFPGRIDTGVLNKILHEGTTPIEQRVPGIDADLAGIVGRALQRDPRDRYQHAADMGRDLARVRRRLADVQPPDPGVAQNTTVAERPRGLPGAKKSDSARQKILTPERFAELQRQQVEEHLRSGEAAFGRGEHDSALHYGERAAMVDPDSPAAIDLINRARFAIESTPLRALLADAGRQLADGRVEHAAALADQAGSKLAHLEGADDLRAELRRISEEIGEARTREQRISASLERARASFEQGGFETALRALYEVLALDPDRTEARELEQSAIAQLQAQRELQRAQRLAYDRLSSARKLADEGRYEEALAAIAGVDSPSDTVRSAAAATAAEVRAQQRGAEVASIVAEARRSFDRHELEQALTALDGIPREDDTPQSRALRADIERALRERKERERKQKAVDEGLQAVTALLERNDLTAAGARLDDIERIGLVDPRIAERRAQLTALVAAAQERRRQEARDRLAAKQVEAARQLVDNGDAYAAVSLLERDGSGHPLVSEALRDVRARIAEQEERARQEAERRRQAEEARRLAELEEARRREEARRAEEARQRDEERRAREAELARRREEFATLVTEAEHALEESDPGQATVLLQRADHARVEDSGLAARAEAARAEVERLEREREEQARREDEARHREEEARRRAEEERQRADAERKRVEEARKKEAAAEAARQAEEARRREEFATLVRAAEHALEESDPEQATVLLQRADRARVEDSGLAARAEAARAEVERLERERAEQARREEASRKEAAFVASLERARQTANHEVALGILREALTILPGDHRAESVVSERRAALEAEQAEAARQAEEARRLEEEAREREVALTRILSHEAKQDPESALTTLQDALTLVPGDGRVQARIAQRRADLERQRAEAERQRQIGLGVSAISEALDRKALDEAEQLLRQAERDFSAPPFKSVRLAYESLRREEARARKEADDAERRRQEQQAREAKEARDRQAREEKEARDREARERKEQTRREKAEAARRQREEKAAQKATAGEAAGTPAWTRYAAAAAVAAVLAGGSAWMLWTRAGDAGPGTTSTGASTQTGGNGAAPTPAPPPPAGGPEQPQVPPPQPTGPAGRQQNAGARGNDAGRGTAGVTPGAETPAQRAAREQAERDQAARDQTVRDQLTRDQAAKEQAARDQAAREQTVRDQAAREQAVREQAARDLAAREQAARDLAAREQAGREQAVQAAQARERAAIQQLLEQYVNAYEALDERRLRQIVAGFPGIPGRALIKSVDVKLSNQRIDVSPDGQTASVTATQNFEYVWNRAGADRTGTGQLSWRLRKNGGAWAVVP